MRDVDVRTVYQTTSLVNPSGVYKRKSEKKNDLKHGNYICKSEENIPVSLALDCGIILSRLRSQSQFQFVFVGDAGGNKQIRRCGKFPVCAVIVVCSKRLLVQARRLERIKDVQNERIKMLHVIYESSSES
jgi:hypothetical protein